jgi:hypothetical protein
VPNRGGGADAAPGWTPVLVRLVLGAATYGAVLGSWHGGLLALYVAVKLPLLLVSTAAVTALFNTLAARAFGLPLPGFACLRLAFEVLSRAGLLLAALAPAAALFVWTAPPPSLAERTAHNVLYLLHTTAVGACGLAAAARLRERLEAVAPTPRAGRAVFAAWVLLFAIVGGELAWALRPFVGSVYEPIVFLRSDAFNGNVFEFVVTDIAPHLLGIPNGDRP